MLTADDYHILGKRVYDLLVQAGCDDHDDREVFQIAHALRYLADQRVIEERLRQRIADAMTGVDTA